MAKKQSRKIMGICGWKNSGKTTLIVSLIPFFLEMGLRVGVVKKTHHQIVRDKPGKDSMLYQEAGASSAALVSDKGWKMMHTPSTLQTMDTTIHKILSYMDEDIILLEGYKFSSFPKIVVLAPPENNQNKNNQGENNHEDSLRSLEWPCVVGFASDERPSFLPSDLAWSRREDMTSLARIIFDKGLDI